MSNIYTSYALDRLTELFESVGIQSEDFIDQLSEEIAQLVVESVSDMELYNSFEALAAGEIDLDIDDLDDSIKEYD